MALDKKEVTTFLKLFDEKSPRLHQVVQSGARLADDATLLNDSVTDRPATMCLYDDKMSRFSCVPPSSIAAMLSPVKETAEEVVEAMNSIAKNIASNGLIVDADAVAPLVDKFGALEGELLQPYLRKQVVSTVDDKFGRVAEMSSSTRTVGTKTQTVQVPTVEPVEGDWTLPELVARMLPLVPTTASHFNYSSIGNPIVNIASTDSPICVSQETVLVFKAALGIDLLNLPDAMTAESIALFNNKVAHVVVGVARNGERKVVPVLEDGKVTSYTSNATSTKGQDVSLAAFIKIGFKNVAHFDASTDPIDGQLLVAPAQWFLRDVASVVQRLVGRDRLSSEYNRVLNLDVAGRKEDFNLKELIDNLNRRTWNGMVSKNLWSDKIKQEIKDAATPEEVRGSIGAIIRHIVKAGWMHMPVRARTAVSSLIPEFDALDTAELEHQMNTRNVLCLVAAKNAVPLLYNTLLRFGCADLDEDKISGRELLASTKPIRVVIQNLSKIACGKEVVYSVSVLDEDGAAPSKKRAVRKPKQVVPPPPPPENELAAALKDLKRSHDELIAEVGDLKALVSRQSRKMRKMVREGLAKNATAASPAQVAAAIAADMDIDDEDEDDDVSTTDECDTSSEADQDSDDESGEEEEAQSDGEKVD